MLKKIKAISLLLSFTIVLIHMMVPHHHHEQMAEFSNNNQEQVSHTHHHGSGSHHHHHDHKEQHADEKESNDPNVPQHVHFTTSDNFDLLRINKISQASCEQLQSTFTINHSFAWDSEELNDILKYPNIWPERAAISQYKPGANGLRGPPSIA